MEWLAGIAWFSLLPAVLQGIAVALLCAVPFVLWEVIAKSFKGS